MTMGTREIEQRRGPVIMRMKAKAADVGKSAEKPGS